MSIRVVPKSESELTPGMSGLPLDFRSTLSSNRLIPRSMASNEYGSKAIPAPKTAHCRRRPTPTDFTQPGQPGDLPSTTSQ